MAGENVAPVEGEDRVLAEVVSLFADARGGPGNFNGTGFQTLTMVRLALEWMQASVWAPAVAGLVCSEPRSLVGDGQVGFDIGLRDGTGPDDLVEVKLNPTPGEVTAVVACARVLAATGGRAATVRLESARRTASFTSLERLVAHRGEARDLEQFQALVAASGDAFEASLFRELGDDPWGVSALLVAPSWCGDEENKRRVVTTARSLSDNEVGLVDRLFRLFHDGAGTRMSFSLRELAEDLTATGLLVEPTRVDVSGIPSELLAAFVVLRECPLPVPADVLAAGLGLSVTELEGLLAEHVAGGYLAVDDGLYSSASKAAPIDVEHGAAAVVAVLAELSRRAQTQGAAYAAQVPNALALARVAARFDPEVAAFAFKGFDKAAKAWGDLNATYDLANVSNAALVQLLEGPQTAEDRKRFGYWRAQTWICGQGWVYQRVGRLDEAASFMRRAKELTDLYDDPENRAFALKCEGRLRRMQAEELDTADPQRLVLLGESEELLTQAFPAFEELLRTNSRFVEDRGECVSLLARTVAAVPDLPRARELAAQARELLVTEETSKAMADLEVLLAEIDAVSRPQDPAGVLADHQSRLEGLLATHSQPVGSIDRSRSEVSARVREVLARLHADAGDAATAERLLQEAAEQYVRLGYDIRHEQIRWRALLVSGRQLPDELVAVLRETKMADGARLRLVESYVERYGDFASAGRHGGDVQPLKLDGLVIESMVREAVAHHAAAATVWGEMPTSA